MGRKECGGNEEPVLWTDMQQPYPMTSDDGSRDGGGCQRPQYISQDLCLSRP